MAAAAILNLLLLPILLTWFIFCSSWLHSCKILLIYLKTAGELLVFMQKSVKIRHFCRPLSRRRTSTKFCMWGRIQDVLFGFEFQKDRLKNVGAVGVEFLAFPLTWHINSSLSSHKPWYIESSLAQTTLCLLSSWVEFSCVVCANLPLHYRYHITLLTKPTPCRADTARPWVVMQVWSRTRVSQ